MTVFEIDAGLFDICFGYTKRSVKGREDLARQHWNTLDAIAREAMTAGETLPVIHKGVKEKYLTIDQEAFKRRAAVHGFDWRS